MRVLSYVKNLDASSYHRVYTPNQKLDAEVKVVRNITEDDLEWCDILHYSRHSVMAPAFLSSMRDKYNFKIIVDNDDWWEVPKDHPKYEFWTRSNIALQIRHHIANADAVICTNDRLMNETTKLNPNCYVLPNALPFGEGQFVYRTSKPADKVRLLYASTVMNYSNTAMIAGAMKKLAHLPIEIVIAGHHESNMFIRLIDNLTAGGLIPHITTPWADAETYMLNYVGDIGILPNKETKFNSLKSNLKAVEYGSMKMPVVVSKCDPYLGMDVDYFSGEKEFINVVTKLVTDQDYRKKRGEDNYRFCKENYDLKNYSKLRKEIYEEVKRGYSNGGEIVTSENDRQYSTTAY
jgi:hypothetical protein